jgi:hypothetical protein
MTKLTTILLVFFTLIAVMPVSVFAAEPACLGPTDPGPVFFARMFPNQAAVGQTLSINYSFLNDFVTRDFVVRFRFYDSTGETFIAEFDETFATFSPGEVWGSWIGTNEPLDQPYNLLVKVGLWSADLTECFREVTMPFIVHATWPPETSQ